MLTGENISKIYRRGREEVKALQEVSFSINSGEMVGIMGPSGSGKTSLMNILGLLDTPDRGRLSINNCYVDEMSEREKLQTRREVVGFIYQDFLLVNSMTALQNVMLPLYFAGKDIFRERASNLLERVGLGQRLHHLPSQLSGGEMQRVAIARAIANDPEVVLADEPTGNLDSVSSEGILNLFHEINKEGKTIIIVTHNIELAKELPRILHLRDGKLLTGDEALATQ